MLEAAEFHSGSLLRILALTSEQSSLFLVECHLANVCAL